jgi:hypothetical protein
MQRAGGVWRRSALASWGLLVAAGAAAGTEPRTVPAGLPEALARREYQATPSERGLQAPNRAHNLRTYFEPGGIRVHDRTAANSPQLLSLTLSGVGRQDPLAPVALGEVVQEGARVEIRRPGLVEWFENSDAGLEQGFTLAARPDGRGELVLELALSEARAARRGDDLVFSTAAGRRLRYGALHVVDAAGRTLPARFELASPQRVRIAVDDAGAAYPIVVDPLLTQVADTQIESDQAGAQLGYSVAGAGDVNGDGYADVIVGAYFYDSGESEEGAAFIFLGSASGIASGGPGAATSTIQSNLTNLEFGRRVAAAGDVNGDGYGDVLISAPHFANGEPDEGAVYVFHGGPSGIPSGSLGGAAARIESNGLGLQLGAHGVASAGDVNGDGYGDVIVGAAVYTTNGIGWPNAGGAFVFHGGASGIGNHGISEADTQLHSEHGGANFGAWASSAGDFDGDGYDDVIVGAPFDDRGHTNEGAAYLFLGGSSGIADADAEAANARFEANQADAELGFSVAPAGDVNGDGYADVIVGAVAYDTGQGTGEGSAFVFHGGASPANGDPTTAAARVDADQAGANLGITVSGAGDVNGDGYADVIVGAYLYDDPSLDEGVALVFHGGTGGIGDGSPANADAKLEQDLANGSMGFCVARAGDVNGDGYADVIIGAHTFDSGQGPTEGAAFVYHGGAQGIVGADPASAASQFESNQGGAEFGYSVASAGDVNGDGYDDVIVGAYQYDAGHSEEGAAFVFLGSAAGIADADPANAHAQLEGDLASASMGSSVASAGDVNGDGYGDVIVGARSYGGTGAAFVFHGSGSGIADGSPATADTELHATEGFSAFGHSVAGAGDVNGDGYADVIVGSRTHDAGESDEGAAFVFLGSASGVDDGGPATADTQLESNQADAEFGWSVAGAGDVNGDGYADVIVGAFDYDEGVGVQEGAAFVFLGSAAGIADGNPSTAAAQLEAGQNNSFLGYSVASAGDVNADGYDDVIVGGVLFSNGHGNEGVALVFHGSASGVLDGNASSADGRIESNDAGAWLGWGVAGAGDVNGDGYADVAASTKGFGVSNGGAAFVFHGSASGIGNRVPANADGRLESDQADADAFNGWSVAGAGDVNGDGFADLIAGAALYGAGEATEGAAFLWYGGRDGDGRPVLARQLRGGSATAVQPWGSSGHVDEFQARMTATHPLGRGRVKLEIEACPPGVAFFGTGCVRKIGSAWTDVTATSAGVVLTETVSDLLGGPLYRWRARVLHAPFRVTQPGITAPPNPAHAPWRMLYGSAGVGIRNLLDTDDDEIPNTLDPDDDGDGLSDADETGVHGTDPLDADSDDDALDDAAEIALGTDPNDPAHDDDGDLDGADNCPFIVNPAQLNGDGFAAGDACQCGDVTGEGTLDAADYQRAREYVVNRTSGPFDLDRCDVSGDAACDVEDLAVLDRALGAAGTLVYGCDAYTGP